MRNPFRKEAKPELAGYYSHQKAMEKLEDIHGVLAPYNEERRQINEGIKSGKIIDFEARRNQALSSEIAHVAILGTVEPSPTLFDQDAESS